MHKAVRYTILPVWILAGIFVVSVAMLLIIPCAIYHCIKDAWLDRKDAKTRPAHAPPVDSPADRSVDPSAHAFVDATDEPDGIHPVPGARNPASEASPSAPCPDPAE